MARRIANAVRIREQSPGKARLDFGRVRAEQLGVAMRWQEARRRVSTFLHGLVRRRWVGDTLILEIEADGAVPLGEVIERSAHALLLPAMRPFTPRLVLSALPISSRERLRWTKDGRLPPSGAVVVRRGQPVSVTTYAVDTITALAADPSIIAQWRADDAAAVQATG